MNADLIKSRMRLAAKAQGMNLIEAADAAGLGRNFGYNTEHPRVDKLYRFAEAVRCCPKWLIFGPDTMPIAGEIPVEEDFDPRRVQIPLLTHTGSNVDQAVVAWGEWDGGCFTEFLRKLQMIGLYDSTMFFELIDGQWVYRYIGGFFIRSLGDYVLSAPGHALGDVDKDKRFALAAAEVYFEAYEEKHPLRDVNDVVSVYDDEPRRFVFDRVILPSRKGVVVMILQTIDPRYLVGLADDQASIGSLSNPARSLPAPVLQNLRVG